jgi:ParB-like chromosome segregation protein Spo0J/N6-adenosine-specific RNA methylase IME4
MKVENRFLQVDTKNLKPNPVNLKVYGEEGIDYRLVDSIEEKGQLEPIVVIEDKEVPGDYIIVSGHRRWVALRELKREATCRLVSGDELEIKEAIIEYNKYRKKTPSQIVNEANLLRSIYADKAKKRQIDALKQNAVVLNSEQREENKKEAGRTRDKVADAVGMRPDTLEKVTKIKEKADAGDEHAKLLMKKLDDEELTVNSAYSYLVLIEAAKTEDQIKDHAMDLLDKVHREIITPHQAIKKLKNLQKKLNERKVDSAGKKNNNNNNDEDTSLEKFYRVALADFSNSHPKLEDFMHLKVPYSEPGILCLLTTTSLLKESIEILDWWGFEYKSMCIWDIDTKDSASWFKGSHELLLLGSRGNWSSPDYKYPSIIREKVGHECIYDMVKRMFPGRVYVDLFSKDYHEGWQRWTVEESKEEFKETCEIKLKELFIELDRNESIKIVLLSEDNQNDSQDPFVKWD